MRVSWPRHRTRLALMVVLCTAAGSFAPAQAQRAGEDWVLLGSRDVDLSLDTDRIDVTAAKGRVKAIRLIAKSTPLLLSKVAVVYAGGQLHNEERRMNMLPNDRSRPIDPGAERFVDRVDLFYTRAAGATAASRRALIEVWGLQTSEGARAERSAPVASAPPAVAAPAPPPAPPAVPRVAAPAPAATPAAPSSPAGGQVAMVPQPPPAAPAPAPAAVPMPTPAPAVVGDATRDGIFLGRQTVSFGVERDLVPVGAETGKFDKLRLRVLDNAIRLTQLRVIYTDGEPDVLSLEADIAAGSRTPWFALKGDRFIREIELVYRKRDGFRGQATVEVYGEFAQGYLDPGGEGSRVARHNGWVPLGAKTAALRIGFDQLEFQMSANKGGFKKLRVDAKERAITLREVRVVYASGEDEVMTIDSARQRVAAGASFGPIDLRGGTRVIRNVVVKTRSRFLDSDARSRDAAIVEVWGQH